MSLAGSYAIAVGLFPRLMALVYLVAFVSLFVQVRGLYCAKGILPIADLVRQLRQNAGWRGMLRYPSLFWFAATDRVIIGCAGAGIVLAGGALFGLSPVVALLLLWLLYASFTSMGQEFLSYQWDSLLLEAGFLAVFLPLVSPRSPAVILALQFFIFRFMISAGTVKLTSRDPTWRNLSALRFHYETQPIPNRIAWYAHQLPPGLQKLSTLGTFFFELAVPFLALGPPPCKFACFCLLVLFQGLIMLTGNYGFFNLLTVVLAVPLLDDRYLAGSEFLASFAAPTVVSSAAHTLTFLVFIPIFLLNLLQLIRLFVRISWLNQVLYLCGRWHITSPYGLFAVMTTDRFEFVIEGSNDLAEWRPYEFRWKPGDPAVPPRQAAPHQPRLDWQMWFAALDPTRMEPWLSRLVERLLEGAPAVVRLFRTTPFRDQPPGYIRLVVYRYHFSNLAAKRASGIWWERQEVGMSAPLTLNR